MSSTTRRVKCETAFVYAKPNAYDVDDGWSICTRPNGHLGKHCSSYIDGWSDWDVGVKAIDDEEDPLTIPMHFNTRYEGEKDESFTLYPDKTMYDHG